mgnify:CR=1 FL=1
MNNLKIGDKVVCIDGSPCKRTGVACTVKVREIYTVSGIKLFGGKKIAIKVKEVEGPKSPISGVEMYIAAYRFRKLKLDYDFVENIFKQVAPKEKDLV